MLNSTIGHAGDDRHVRKRLISRAASRGGQWRGALIDMRSCHRPVRFRWSLVAGSRDQLRRPQAKHEGVNRSWVCAAHRSRHIKGRPAPSMDSGRLFSPPPPPFGGTPPPAAPGHPWPAQPPSLRTRRRAEWNACLFFGRHLTSRPVMAARPACCVLPAVVMPPPVRVPHTAEWPFRRLPYARSVVDVARTFRGRGALVLSSTSNRPRPNLQKGRSRCKGIEAVHRLHFTSKTPGII